MNCNPCCGCFPPITTYNPSVADNFPTILQQVEYLKALLKKYPSQQWFITQEKVTEETTYLNKLSILSNGREPQGGDFILGNKENGTTLLFQYTGVITEYVNYNLIYVGVFTNQDIAEEAFAKAQQALDLAATNEQDIAKLEQNKVDKIKSTSEYVQIYGVSKEGAETTYELSEEVVPWKIVRRNAAGNIKSNSAIENNDVVINEDFRNELYKKQDKITDTTNLDAHYISAISGFRKVTLVGSTKTYDNIYFEKGSEVGDIYVLTRGNTKTLFGKKLYGTGNIDLYKHSIKITANISGYGATYAEIYFDEFSSKNTVVDSIEDLKTLLGNTFEKPVSGIAASDTADLQIMYITQDGMYGYGKNWTFASATNIEITDAITTI